MYTVPANTNFIQVQATGASGTPSAGVNDGGLGAKLTAVLQVIPGEVLTVVIGKQRVVVGTQSNQIKGGASY